MILLNKGDAIVYASAIFLVNLVNVQTKVPPSWRVRDD